jgi:hypothetical protein
MSASQRRKGADAERDAVNWLRSHGYPDARRYLAGDGRQPGDIDAIPAVTIDVKDVATLAIPAWLNQVEAEAGPRRLPLLWIRRPRLTDPGDWWAITRMRHLLPLLGDGTEEAAS